MTVVYRIWDWVQGKAAVELGLQRGEKWDHKEGFRGHISGPLHRLLVLISMFQAWYSKFQILNMKPLSEDRHFSRSMADKRTSSKWEWIRRVFEGVALSPCDCDSRRQGKHDCWWKPGLGVLLTGWLGSGICIMLNLRQSSLTFCLIFYCVSTIC